MQQSKTRYFLIDLGTIALVSLIICLGAHELVFMSIVVPLVIMGRTWLVTRSSSSQECWKECFFFLICFVVGAFNDWNSVSNKQIYAYDVPAFFPKLSTIPFWMLLYWGMILRFFSRFAMWEKLGSNLRPSNSVYLGKHTVDSVWLKLLIEGMLILVTRQCIYNWYLEPNLSWLPFAIALGIYILLFRMDRSDWILILAFFAGGPLFEMLYIQVANLHHYHLGVVGGVPIWIILWWGVAVMIWKDMTLRIFQLFQTNIESLEPYAHR